MNIIQEKVCIANIQSYLDAIWAKENGKEIPPKSCKLCRVFWVDDRSSGRGDNCPYCPLGPLEHGCSNSTYIDSGEDWYFSPIPKMQKRMKWLLKKYKKAGLEIEIK